MNKSKREWEEYNNQIVHLVNRFQFFLLLHSFDGNETTIMMAMAMTMMIIEDIGPTIYAHTMCIIHYWCSQILTAVALLWLTLTYHYVWYHSMKILLNYVRTISVLSFIHRFTLFHYYSIEKKNQVHTIHVYILFSSACILHILRMPVAMRCDLNDRKKQAKEQNTSENSVFFSIDCCIIQSISVSLYRLWPAMARKNHNIYNTYIFWEPSWIFIDQ